MKPKWRQQEYGCGHLPAIAPLANPYVPFQTEQPPKYDPRRGTVRGTMFPGLDLPFQGRTNTKELTVTPMTELQVLNFAVQDLALYLDTHPDDQEALEAYRAYQKQYHQQCAQYQEKYGPMNHLSYDTCDHYRWLNDPWPWEYAKNKGV